MAGKRRLALRTDCRLKFRIAITVCSEDLRALMTAWTPESQALALPDRCQRLRKKPPSEMLRLNLVEPRVGGT